MVLLGKACRSSKSPRPIGWSWWGDGVAFRVGFKVVRLISGMLVIT